MSININRITNANVYNAGNSLLGQVEEITLPSIKSLMTDHKALGMKVMIELPAGFEKMAGKIKWNAIYEEFITQFGNPYTTSQIQVRCNVESWDASGLATEVPLVAFLTVRFKDALPGVTFKQNDNPDAESEYTCTYYRLELDGVPLIELDAMANSFFVNSVDVFAAYRINIGL